MRYQAGIMRPGYNALKVPNAPTIGTATAGTSLCASVTFTAPSCVGGGAITSYTVFSNCGGKTASGASSPLVVTGLTASSSYTFKAIATNAYGPSYPSGSSNSLLLTCATFQTVGSFCWVAPPSVTSVAVVAIGGGGNTGFFSTGGYPGGGGGALAYANNITVTPGNSYSVVVGSAGVGFGASGGFSSFNTSTVKAGGGTTNNSSTAGGAGGTVINGTGGAGGAGGSDPLLGTQAGNGGAGGYAGAGGKGGDSNNYANATAGSGGGGGGGNAFNASGGGVGLYGQGTSGAAGNPGSAGSGGSGTLYGGGKAGIGAVRIVWAGGSRGTPSFPSTNVGA
jgi:hypothetical protein